MEQTEVSFEGAAARLAGTLTLPQGIKRPPMVLFIHGSGPLDRNENAKRIRLNIFNILARTLAQNGIGSLRYDKRGCGTSGGNYLKAGHFDLVDDAEKAFEYLRFHTGILTGPLFIAGHSEGSIIAPQIANRRNDVDGIILIAPFLQKLDEILIAQAGHLSENIKTMPGFAGFATRLVVGLFGGIKNKQASTVKKLKNSRTDIIRIDFQRLNARWFRELMSIDPIEIFEKTSVPTLLIAGEKDVQCAPEDAAKIAALIGEKAQYHVIDDLTHILRLESGPASITNYKKLLKKPIDPIIGRLITDWIKSQK